MPNIGKYFLYFMCLKKKEVWIWIAPGLKILNNRLPSMTLIFITMEKNAKLAYRSRYKQALWRLAIGDRNISQPLFAVNKMPIKSINTPNSELFKHEPGLTVADNC